MIPSLEQFYNHQYVFHKEWEDLVIFCYTRECQYDQVWDEVTTLARGIIFNRHTGEVIAIPFKKFFNFEEIIEKVDLFEISKKPFIVTEKMDGSLGIHYRYKDQDWIASKGSFQSTQAEWATKWFRRHIDPSKINQEYTYLFEIIYPDNRIVIDYGDMSGLILIGAINKQTGLEMEYHSLEQAAMLINAEVVRREQNFSNLDELYKYCKSLPMDKEGFVLTFNNGLKIKIKGQEYCRIHKAIARITPLFFWDAWDVETQDIPKSFLSQIPEEFRVTTDELHQQIRDIHFDMYNDIKKAYENIMRVRSQYPNEKSFINTLEIMYPELVSFILFYKKGNFSKLWNRIHRNVRPTSNILPDSLKGSDRLKRILQEN